MFRKVNIYAAVLAIVANAFFLHKNHFFDIIKSYNFSKSQEKNGLEDSSLDQEWEEFNKWRLDRPKI